MIEEEKLGIDSMPVPYYPPISRGRWRWGAGILRALRMISKSNGTRPVFQKPLRIFSGVKAIFGPLLREYKNCLSIRLGISLPPLVKNRNMQLSVEKKPQHRRVERNVLKLFTVLKPLSFLKKRKYILDKNQNTSAKRD